MSIYHFQEGLPPFRKAVVTIGSFDGVHLGHKKILETIVAKAREIGGESIVVTFDPHPRKVIRPDLPIHMITSNKEKYEQIIAAGVDHIIEVPFTRQFSLLSAEEYVHDFLLEKINPHAVIIGYDHHFGHDREGDIRLLKSMAGSRVEIIEIPEQLIDDANVSSTKIRKAVEQGDVALAESMLGRPYRFSGLVIHGKKLGRKIGFPTANLKPDFDDQLLLPSGIYAVYVRYLDHTYLGAMSIGKNPTVTNEEKLHYEVYILDFDEDIYGQELTILFKDKIREEKKFHHLDDLIVQIRNDVSAVRNLLA
ncbi:MAG: bifunctional riboflavin kinase/FAD synthetase [Taibaiella sp.]|nr:bifunctional riboflavin kinase/FAD synthetase [Taibaiella sp.]